MPPVASPVVAVGKRREFKGDVRPLDQRFVRAHLVQGFLRQLQGACLVIADPAGTALRPARLPQPDDSHPGESARVEWVPLSEVPKLAAEGQIQDGPPLTALAYYMAFERAC